MFTNSKGTSLEAQNVVNGSFKPLFVRAGLLPVRSHGLRHSCLSLLASLREPTRDLQALARHAAQSSCSGCDELSLTGCQYAVITGDRKCRLEMRLRIDQSREKQERFSGTGRDS